MNAARPVDSYRCLVTSYQFDDVRCFKSQSRGLRSAESIPISVQCHL